MKSAGFLRQFSRQARANNRKIRSIYLFGSRANGTSLRDSDYDLLLLVSSNFTARDKDRLYGRVVDVLLKNNKVLSLKIYQERVFNKLRALGTPFSQRVMAEGVKLG